MSEREMQAYEWERYRERVGHEHPTWSTRQIDKATRALANRESYNAEVLEAADRELRKGKSKPAMVRLKWAVVAVLVVWFITAHGGCNYSEDAETTQRLKP